MRFEEFVRDFWWLMFPVFGMVMAFWGMRQADNNSKQVIDLIKSYMDQGKEPPLELLKLASQAWQESTPAANGPTRQSSAVWTFVTFFAMAAGFGVGWFMVREESWAFAFALVSVVMGVMALGALLLLFLGRK